MLMSVAATKLSWLAAFAMVVGVACLALHERDAAMLLIGAGCAWGSTIATVEARGTNGDKVDPPRDPSH